MLFQPQSVTEGKLRLRETLVTCPRSRRESEGTEDSNPGLTLGRCSLGFNDKGNMMWKVRTSLLTDHPSDTQGGHTWAGLEGHWKATFWKPGSPGPATLPWNTGMTFSRMPLIHFGQKQSQWGGKSQQPLGPHGRG